MRLVVNFLAITYPPTGTEKNGEPRTSKYGEDVARSASTSSERTREAGQSDCGPARIEWNKLDAEPKRQGAHYVRCRPKKDSQSSKGTLGKGKAGTKGERLVKLTIRHDDHSNIAYRLPSIAVGESIREQKAQDSETAIIHWRADEGRPPNAAH
jgi:hypothetical protein